MPSPISRWGLMLKAVAPVCTGMDCATSCGMAVGPTSILPDRRLIVLRPPPAGQ
jgi:hypothetical protein